MQGGEIQTVPELARLVQLRFGEMDRRLFGVEKAVKEHGPNCSACHEGLVGMIHGTEAYARDLVERVADKMMAEFLSKYRDHERRIRAQERGSWKLAGMGALAGVLGGAALTSLGRWAIERLLG